MCSVLKEKMQASGKEIFPLQLVNHWCLEDVAVRWGFCHDTLSIRNMYSCGCMGEPVSGVLEGEGAKESCSSVLDNRNGVTHLFIHFFS